MVLKSIFSRDILSRGALFFLLFLLFLPALVSAWGRGEKYLSKSMAKNMGLQIMNYNEYSALSIALMSEGKILWTMELGYADQDAETPVTRETMFGIGSVSKVISATAVMKLVDQGLVHLDTPLTVYLSDFHMLSPKYKDITVRMLLNHSSGLPGGNYRGCVTDIPWPEYQDVVYQSIRKSRLKHLPGHMHVYCNDGYTLVELLVQAVTGKPFTDFVEEEIFIPLQMTRSSFATSSLPEGSFARAFHDGWTLPLEIQNSHAAGGIYSTPEDLVRFIAMISARGDVNGTRFISEASLDAMGKDQTAGTFRVIDSNFYTFGLGWDNTHHPGPGSVGQKALTKNGGTLMYGAELWVIPEENLGVAVVAVNAPYSDLADLAQNTLLAALVDKGTLYSMPELIARPLSLPEVPSDELLGAITGYYANYTDLFKVTSLPDKNIQLHTRDQGKWLTLLPEMNYRKNGWFAAKDNPYQEISFQTKDGRKYLVMRSFKGYYFVEIPIAQHLQKTEALSPAWISRLDKAWLIANEIANSYTFHFANYPKMNIETIEDLPGYLFIWEPGDYLTFFAGSEQDIAYMNLQIPINSGRDLCDLEVVKKGEEEWLRCSGYLYRPLETIPYLEYGTSMQLTVREQYITEWVHLEKPVTGANIELKVSSDARWKIYNSRFKQIASGRGSASIFLGIGKETYFLALYAEPGQTMDLSLR
jgi:CubicO group peptidase (beta-lactamase class C family)